MKLDLSKLKGCLADERIVITGACGGIGQATVDLYYRLGAKIVAVDKDKGKLECLNEKYPNIETKPCDLSIEKDVWSWLDFATDPINHLICIAGGALKEEWDDENNDLLVPPHIARKTIDANYFSAYNSIFKRLPNLQLAAKNTGDASIVLTGSINFKIDYRLPAYTSAKGALVGLMRASVWKFGQKGIRINVLEPGSVRTPLTDAEPKDHDALLKRMPLGRFTTPEDCAMAYFTLTHLNKAINGQEIVVDGGQSVIKYF